MAFSQPHETAEASALTAGKALSKACSVDDRESDADYHSQGHSSWALPAIVLRCQAQQVATMDGIETGFGFPNLENSTEMIRMPSIGSQASKSWLDPQTAAALPQMSTHAVFSHEVALGVSSGRYVCLA